MDERLIRLRPDDQRKVRNGGYETRVPGCVEISQLPDPCGRFLRVADNGQGKAALLF
jgi:hypothetical protein